MENYIPISKINDFLFCPKSLYLHSIYESFSEKIVHSKYQVEGRFKHKSIEEKSYSTAKRFIVGKEVYYDFGNDKKRARFAKFLKKYGRKVQYSVYEIRNSQRILQNILTEIKLYYEKDFNGSDSVLIIELCKSCKRKIKRYGYSANEEKDVVIFD